ncbi:MAG: hypothetical protein ACYS30_19465 [Planctomycetota bacterium]
MNHQDVSSGGAIEILADLYRQGQWENVGIAPDFQLISLGLHSWILINPPTLPVREVDLPYLSTLLPPSTIENPCPPYIFVLIRRKKPIVGRFRKNAQTPELTILMPEDRFLYPVEVKVPRV